MSRYLSTLGKTLVPYVPGEQPQDRKYIKLNTNESPFPPSPKAVARAQEEAERLQLYSDPDCRSILQALADRYQVPQDCVIVGNGSDEILHFAFEAFCDADCPAVFPDISYGFYPIAARLSGVPYREIPLTEDFSVCPADYFEAKGTVVLANPNAPTGKALPLGDIEDILRHNPDHVVIIDEAYVDFGGESAVPLTKSYDNLLVVQTFSKSRSLAGARLGFAIGAPALIRDLNSIRCSINPYNVNRMTMAAGVGALEDEDYTRANAQAVIAARDYTEKALKGLGFTVLPSRTNFVFASHPNYDGKQLYLDLKERGILVRHFDKDRLRPFNRITIGSQSEMEILMKTITALMEEKV